MPLFTFDHYQLTQLSLASRSNPNELSPIMKINIAAAAGEDREKMQESLDDLIRLSLIEKTDDSTILAKELEPAFLIIHRPEQVWKFYRESLVESGEENFCWLAGAGVQITVGPAYLHHIVKYPYTEEMVRDWFVDEFAKDLSVPQAGFKKVRILLEENEVLILSLMQVIYKHRVSGDSPIENKAIDIRELINFNYWEDLPLSLREGNFQYLKTHLRNSEMTLKSLAGLRLKKLLVINGQKLQFSVLAQEIFDPGKQIDYIQFSIFDENNPKIATINAVNRGYVVQRPWGEKAAVALDLLPADTKPDKLYDILMADPTKEKKEVKKQVAKRKEVKGETKFCPSCGSKLDKDAKFCNNCGFQFVEKEEKIFCKNCGAELKPDTVFCPSCGTRR
jgi:RNA polymerase subunit RPABC4/transcription elongation factor Spt4